MLQIARPLFLLLLVVGAVFIGVTTDRMPDRIASHFGANGQANGFMDPSSYRMFMLGMAVGIPLFVVLVVGLLPRRVPAAINLPHREYWLSAARREATLQYLETHAYWMGSLLVVFMAALHALLIAANATQPAHLPGPPFAMLMAAFLIASAGWALTLVRHFRRKP